MFHRYYLVTHYASIQQIKWTETMPELIAGLTWKIQKWYHAPCGNKYGKIKKHDLWIVLIHTLVKMSYTNFSSIYKKTD